MACRKFLLWINGRTSYLHLPSCGFNGRITINSSSRRFAYATAAAAAAAAFSFGSPSSLSS